MKWVVIIFLSLFLSGCNTFHERNESYLVTGFDFTPFVEKGFYYSPNTYNGKYVTMGTLDILFTSEIKESNYEENQDPPKGWLVYIKKGRYVKEKVFSARELLEKMYQEALKLKGNGIMEFRMTFEQDGYYGTFNPRFTGTVIKITE